MSAAEARSAFPYVEWAVGGASRRNDVRRIGEYAPNGHADCYRSMLRFPETLPAYAEHNQGSVKGYKGESKADFFAADFDHKPDFSKALEDARQTVRRWEAVYGVPVGGLRYYFSGLKGVHVEIPEVLFGGLEPGRDTAARLKAVAREMLGQSETADFGIYDTTRLWRTPNTKHPKSGLYKVPLYPNEFFNSGFEEIRKLATECRVGFVHTDPSEFEPVSELVRLWERSRDENIDERHERLDTAEILNGVPEGERDSKLFKLACKLRGADVPQDMAEELVAKAARNCEPPFPEREALQKVVNAYNRYSPNANGSRLLSSSSMPLGDSGDDDNNDSPAEVVWFSRLGQPKEREYLIKDVCAKGYPLVAFGAGGVAKSLGMLLAGIAIAGGASEWWGMRVLEHGPVLYLDFELDVDEQHRRVRDLCAGLCIDLPDELAYLSGVGLTTDAAFDRALRFCKEFEAKAVIVDSMGLAMQGDMEQAKDVLAFHSRYVNLLRRAGVTPFLVDHEGKRQAGEKHRDKSPFGSAYKAWAARSVLQFELDEYDRENGALDIRVRQTKTNFGPKLEPFGVRFTFAHQKIATEAFELEDAELVEEESMPARDRIVGALRPGPTTRHELEKLTGLSGGTIRNNLSDLMKNGIVGEDGYQGRSKVYRLLSSSSENPKSGDSDDNKQVPLSFDARAGESTMLADLKERREREEIEAHPLACECVDCTSPGSSTPGGWEGTL